MFEQPLHLGAKKIEFHIPAETSMRAEEEEEEEEEETQEEAAGDVQHTSQDGTLVIVINVVQIIFCSLCR